MLSEAEFESWCSQLNLSDDASTLVARIRTSEPARRVGGGYANVCGRYPSLKMGKTIQFESHKVELPAIEAYEADTKVLEYYDQPTHLKLSFTSIKGRTIRCQHVPDFLVLRRTSVGFEEWKPEKRLVELAQKQPNHYHQDADGQWHNSPAEADAATYGISYCLRLDRTSQSPISQKLSGWQLSRRGSRQNRPYRQGCNNTRHHHYSTASVHPHGKFR